MLALAEVLKCLKWFCRTMQPQAGRRTVCREQNPSAWGRNSGLSEISFYLPILELDISLQLPNMAISNALLQFLESEKILGDMKLIEPDPFAI